MLNGQGLWDGIAGNGYILHSIFRCFDHFSRTDEDKVKAEKFGKIAKIWETRAFLFAKALNDPQIIDKISEFDDGTKVRKGIPNYPFSLMEGLSGPITLISDLLLNKRAVLFPGLEITN